MFFNKSLYFSTVHVSLHNSILGSLSNSSNYTELATNDFARKGDNLASSVSEINNTTWVRCTYNLYSILS